MCSQSLRRYYYKNIRIYLIVFFSLFFLFLSTFSHTEDYLPDIRTMPFEKSLAIAPHLSRAVFESTYCKKKKKKTTHAFIEKRGICRFVQWVDHLSFWDRRSNVIRRRVWKQEATKVKHWSKKKKNMSVRCKKIRSFVRWLFLEHFFTRTFVFWKKKKTIIFY